MRASEAAQKFAPVFAALGDNVRIHLVHRLLEGQEHSISELAQGLEISHQGITKHLKVMEQAGLVRGVRHGRERRYVGEPKKVAQACDYLADIAHQWDAALIRLHDFLDAQEK